MTELDRLTEGERERRLLSLLRQDELTPDEADALTPDFFFKLQVQTISRCNAACVTCPYPEVADALPMGRMEESLFRLVVEQIRGRGVERVGLFLMNEPLVDRRLEAFTAHLKDREPATKATIITNGALLTGERAQALADAGMDEISVSVNGLEPASYERTMQGLSFEAVRSNLLEVGERLGAGRLGGLDVRVVTLELPGTRERLERFREEVGLPVLVKPVTNRAGSIDAEALQPDRARRERPTLCQRPFVKAYVLYDGDYVLCNCDWRRTTIIGNVKEAPLATLWKDERLRRVRRAHAERTFPADSPCARCDYPWLIDA